MKTTKKLGVWMDHSTAHLIDVNAEKKQQSIHSTFNDSTREEALSCSEKLMHNKEQQMHEAYYEQIGDEILKYNHVLLFGPTHAKTELFNYLTQNSHFKDIQIDVEAADKMSDNEQVAFVKKHFNA